MISYDWLAIASIIYFGKPLYFNCYVAKFLTELYELCNIITSISSLFIHEHMSIWYVHVNSDSMWINKIRSLHVEGGSYEIPPREDSYLKTIRSLYLGGTWPDEIPLLWRHVIRLDPFILEAHVARRDPFNLKAHGQNEIPPSLKACGSPCRLVLCDDSQELSSLPDQATQG